METRIGVFRVVQTVHANLHGKGHGAVKKVVVHVLGPGQNHHTLAAAGGANAHEGHLIQPLFPLHGGEDFVGSFRLHQAALDGNNFAAFSVKGEFSVLHAKLHVVAIARALATGDDGIHANVHIADASRSIGDPPPLPTQLFFSVQG